MVITRRTAAIGLGLMLAAPAAWAQAPAPVRIRAVIDAVDGNTLMVTSREGTKLTIRLVGAGTVIALAKASMADIKPGAYVGVTAVQVEEGIWRAHEVHIFPEAMRGTGEGDRPWDLMPRSTMTNATVAETVQRVDGHALTLKFKDGEKKVLVTSATVIVAYVPDDKSELKPGAKIFVPQATKQPDGTFETARLNVGRDVDPPM